MQNYRIPQTPCHACRPMLPNTPDRIPKHDMPLAMAYVPWQEWCEIYEVEKAFKCGTIFKELNLPFLGKGGIRR